MEKNIRRTALLSALAVCFLAAALMLASCTAREGVQGASGNAASKQTAVPEASATATSDDSIKLSPAPEPEADPTAEATAQSTNEPEVSSSAEPDSFAGLFAGEVPITEGIVAAGKAQLPYSSISAYYGAGIILLELPGMTVELQSNNADIRNRSIVNNTEHSRRITANNALISIMNAEVYGEDPSVPSGQSWHYQLYEENNTVRMIIRDGDRIAGYALACFWNLFSPDVNPWFIDGRLVKAVYFEDYETRAVSEEEVNARLDEAYRFVVEESGLFDTIDEFWLQYKDSVYKKG